MGPRRRGVLLALAAACSGAGPARAAEEVTVAQARDFCVESPRSLQATKLLMGFNEGLMAEDAWGKPKEKEEAERVGALVRLRMLELKAYAVINAIQDREGPVSAREVADLPQAVHDIHREFVHLLDPAERPHEPEETAFTEPDRGAATDPDGKKKWPDLPIGPEAKQRCDDAVKWGVSVKKDLAPLGREACYLPKVLGPKRSDQPRPGREAVIAYRRYFVACLDADLHDLGRRLESLSARASSETSAKLAGKVSGALGKPDFGSAAPATGLSGGAAAGSPDAATKALAGSPAKDPLPEWLRSDLDTVAPPPPLGSSEKADAAPARGASLEDLLGAYIYQARSFLYSLKPGTEKLRPAFGSMMDLLLPTRQVEQDALYGDCRDCAGRVAKLAGLKKEGFDRLGASKVNASLPAAARLDFSSPEGFRASLEWSEALRGAKVPLGDCPAPARRIQTAATSVTCGFADTEVVGDPKYPGRCLYGPKGELKGSYWRYTLDGKSTRMCRIEADAKWEPVDAAAAFPYPFGREAEKQARIARGAVNRVRGKIEVSSVAVAVLKKGGVVVGLGGPGDLRPLRSALEAELKKLPDAVYTVGVEDFPAGELKDVAPGSAGNGNLHCAEKRLFMAFRQGAARLDDIAELAVIWNGEPKKERNLYGTPGRPDFMLPCPHCLHNAAALLAPAPSAAATK